MAEEKLIIEVEYKDHDAKRQVDDLTSSINALNAATTGKGFKSLGHVAKNLAAITTSASNLDGIGRKLNDLALGATKVFDTFKSFDPKAYSNNIKSLTSAINSISNAVGNLSQKGSGLKAVSDALKQLPSAANKDIGKKTNLSGAANSAKIASKMFKDLGNNIKTVAKAGWELGKMPFKMILSPIQAVGRGIMDMGKRFTTFLSGIGRIALYRAIRTGIKLVTSAVREGVNNLYIWAGMVGNSFKPTMDSLATSFLYLKNSIGAMVSPLLDALAPALETVVNQIVDVLNIFNQVIATMTGATTWRKALRAPASYADNISGLGHDAEDANDAVKELKRTILGFDEINKLEDKTKTTVPKSNGKDATGYYAKQGAFSFTEVPISQTALDIAKMLKDAWEKGDFTSIGDMIGQKVGSALMSVPWEQKIQPAVKKLATSAGTLLNGMFDYNGRGGKAMWDGIAYTIYNALNTAVLGYVTFFDTVNWTGIGNGIGAALKKVCRNIKWGWVADALAAFPNAVIDTLTGFTQKFTVQDFYQLGQNIGRTVSKAITEIKWADLFKNTFKIATGIVAAFNGALTSFDWSSVKGAILGGIKKIPAKSWSDLGKQIGEAIFNITVFVANLVDTFVRFIEAGNWGALYDGIKTGITNGMKQYGGWKGISKKLGGWIVEHIGTISLLLAFAVGLPLLKALPAAFATTVLNGLKLKQVPGTGTTLGAWVKNLSLAAGIVLAINTFGSIWGHNFKKSSIKDNLIYTLKSGFKGALAGALIGWQIGGLHGALIGATIGLAITLAVIGLNWDPFSEETRAEISKGLQENIDREVADAAANLDALDLNKQNQLETYYQNREYGAGNTGSGVTTGTLTVSLDPTAAPNAWEQLSKQWQKIVNVKKVAEFLTKGLLNKGGDWWKSAQTFWENAIHGKNAKEFTIAGIVDKASTWWSDVQRYWKTRISGQTASRFTIAGIWDRATTWWSEVKGYWSNAISGNTASRFTVEGIWNKASTWWKEVKGYWSETISGNTASKFEVGGVKNQAGTWWKDVKSYWSDATSGKTLKAKASISNAYNAFVSAFNTMQTNFNNHPLTAFVKTQTVKTTNFSKAYQGKANGGIYKDGQWHDITKYAAGALDVQSGEIFVAREAGPELVGSIGGNTAVVNNDQIVASVSAGVAQAVASVLGGGNTNEITIKVDSEVLYRAVRKGERMASGRYGTAIAIG